ncbi:MAG: heme o synthase [Bdellovibrionota bacterium]
MSILTISTIKNYIELTKPRIAFFCLIMTAGGVILASDKISILSLIMTFIGTALSVASANTFNMVYERHTDQFMKRTQFRPMVVGKIKVKHALIFACVLAVVSLTLLVYFVNILTAVLAFAAIVFYAAIYTPLKVKTPLALVIGAVPGAIPPLLGWTAVDNKVTPAALALFGVLFAWQMPHFIAIAIYHKADYAKAGIQVVPVVRGERAAKIQALLWTICLVLMSMLLIYFKLGGYIYAFFAVTLGFWFLYLSLVGLFRVTPNWPRKFFIASLIYLPALVLGLIIDRCASFLKF